MRRMAPTINTLIALLAFATLAGSGVALEALDFGSLHVPAAPIATPGEAGAAARISSAAGTICLTGYEVALPADNNPTKLRVSVADAL